MTAYTDESGRPVSKPAWHIVNTNFVPWAVNMHSISPYGTTNWSIFSSGVSQ